MPTLCLTSEDDSVVRAAGVRAFAEGLPAPFEVTFEKPGLPVPVLGSNSHPRIGPAARVPPWARGPQTAPSLPSASSPNLSSSRV